MTEEQKGDLIAKAIWAWLQERKAIQFVPWVLNPASEHFDATKAAVQKERDNLLGELESLIRRTSASLGEHG